LVGIENFVTDMIIQGGHAIVGAELGEAGVRIPGDGVDGSKDGDTVAIPVSGEIQSLARLAQITLAVRHLGQC
jgi:hypothetical protein